MWRLVSISDQRQLEKILTEMSLSLLNELKGLLTKVVDPGWPRKLEQDGK
jgi:hypothetical protein